MTDARYRSLTNIPGIGETLAARLIRRNIYTRAELRNIIDELPRATQAHIRHRVSRRIDRTTARALVAELRRRLVVSAPHQLVAVGSVRRGARASKDVDILVVVPGARYIYGTLASATLRPPRPRDRVEIVDTYAGGARRRSIIVGYTAARRRTCYYAVDLFLATEDERPFAMFHYTGSARYNIRVRAHAKRLGYVLNQYGIYNAATGAAVAKNIRTERELLRFLGVTYKPPAQRCE